MSEIKYFPSNLKHLRTQIDLTQSEFGDKIGLKKSQISTYENGNSDPPIPVAIKICDFFDVKMDDLFRGYIHPSESPPENPPPKLHPIRDGDTEGVTTESAGSAVAVGLKQPVAAESPPVLREEMKALQKTVYEAVLKMGQLQEAVELQGSNFDK